MGKLCRLFVALFLLTACSADVRDVNFSKGHSVIDWVDFIKLNGKEYNGIQTGVIADRSYVGEEIGEVEFMVADNVTNPEYQIKNGDAAFWEEGTKVHAVKSDPFLAAVKDNREINGYRLYDVRTGRDHYSRHFKDMRQEEVQKIALYSRSGDGTHRLLKIIEAKKDIQQFLLLLNRGKEQPSFTPDNSKGDPAVFQMVFYTSGPVAYNFSLHFDGKSFFWHPRDTAVLPHEIETYIVNDID